MVRCNELRVIIFLFFCVFFISYGCGDSDSKFDSTFVTSLHILNTDNQEKTVFSQGEQIQFKLNITNRSDSSQTLTFRSSQLFDFIVRKKGTSNIIWQWSHDSRFSQVITHLLFKPGEKKTFTETWDQLDNNGILINFGQYEVQGIVVDQNGLDDTSNDFEFRTSYVQFEVLQKIL
ncbi:MAG: BsuPI-related putative proteinase inhibitor [Candidatus Hodarchaeales archaeon]|jgi:hypothetical protein